MGIALMVEVLDHYHGHDARKLWLLAFAEQANDRTRQGWPGRALLAARTGRSASRASHIASELAAEGVVERLGGGNRSGSERYALHPLAPSATTGKGSARANPESRQKGAARAHSSDTSMGAPRAHPKPQVKGAESRGKGAESEIKGAASSPLPAETRSSNPSVIQPSEPSKSSAASSSIENILGDPGLGSPQRSRKTADLNGDQPIPVDVSAVDTDTERVAAYELAVLADRAGDTTPVPDGYAARVAAVILATAGRTVHMPVLYVRKVIKAEPARYWPPNGTR